MAASEKSYFRISSLQICGDQRFVCRINFVFIYCGLNNDYYRFSNEKAIIVSVDQNSVAGEDVSTTI